MLLKADLFSVKYPPECCAVATMSYYRTDVRVRIKYLSIVSDAGETEGKLNECHGGTARESYYNIKFGIPVACSLA